MNREKDVSNNVERVRKTGFRIFNMGGRVRPEKGSIIKMNNDNLKEHKEEKTCQKDKK